MFQDSDTIASWSPQQMLEYVKNALRDDDVGALQKKISGISNVTATPTGDAQVPVWSSSANQWVSQALDINKVVTTYQIARCSASVAGFGVGPVDVTGATLTPGVTGTYLVWATFDITFQVAGNATVIGTVVASGGTFTGTSARLLDAAGGPILRATVCAQGTWVCTSASQSIKLQIGKNVAAGTTDCNNTDTSIMILRVN